MSDVIPFLSSPSARTLAIISAVLSQSFLWAGVQNDQPVIAEEEHPVLKTYRSPPDVGGMGLGRPGFMVEFNLSDDMEFEDRNDSFSLIDLKTRFPLYYTKNDWAYFGISGVYEAFWIDSISTGNRDLHTFGLSLDAASRSRQSGWAWMARLRPEWSFENGSLDGDSMSVSFIGTYGYRFHESLMVGAGLYAQYGFDDFVAFPSIGVIWRPTQDTYLQITPPIVNLAWMPGEQWTFFFNTYLFGGDWSLDDGESGDAAFLSMRMFRSTLGTKYQINDHLSVGVHVGLNFNGNLELRDRNHRVLQDDDLKPGVYGGVSLNWSF